MRKPRHPALATAAAAFAAALALVLVTAVARPALAAGAPPAVAEPLPPPPAGSTALYDRYPLEAYMVDEGDYGSDVAARQGHNTVNLLMISRAWLVKLSVRVAEQALTFRPAAALAVTARQLSLQMSDLFWPSSAPLVMAALAAAGLWGLLLHLRGRPGSAWRALIGTALTLVMAGATLASLDRVLATLDELSHELSRLSFTAATRPLGPAPELTTPIQTAGDEAWRRLALAPWVAAEFTNTAAADLYSVGGIPGIAILTIPPTERRSHYLSMSYAEQERRFAPWRRDRLPARMLTAGAGLVGAVGWALGLLILAGGLLVYDLLLLLLVVATPLAALLALWPGLGPRLAPAWGARLLGAALGKAAAGLLLGLFLTISVGLFKLAEPGGWPLAALFQWLLLIALLRLGLHSPARLVAGVTWLWQTGAEAAHTGDGRLRSPWAAPGRPAAAAGPAGLPALVAAPPALAADRPASQRPASVLTWQTVTPTAPTAGEHLTTELTRLQADLAADSPQRPTEPPWAVAENGGGSRAAARDGGLAPALAPAAPPSTGPAKTVQAVAETPSGRTGRAGGPGLSGSEKPQPESVPGLPGDRPPGLPVS